MMKKKYFQCRDKSFYTKHTKEELCNLIDPYDFNTVKPFLKEMDYLAYEEEYFNLLKYSKLKEPKYVLVRYIAWANLAVPRQWGYEDWELTHKKN